MKDQEIYEELTKIRGDIAGIRVDFATLSTIVQDYTVLKEAVQRHERVLAEKRGETAMKSQDTNGADQKARLSRATWTAVAQWAAVFVAMGATFWAAFKK